METILRLCAVTLLLPATVLALSFHVAASDDGHYRYGKASRDGIGKFYLGREISHVMGHRGAGWLERPARTGEERTDVLISLLPLESGDTAADIGAGTGYFSLPMAAQVGATGRIMAVDIQPEMLAIIEQRMQSAGVSNITPVLGSEADPRLPPGEVDLVLLVDAYHEFSHPREVMSQVQKSLSARGKVVLVEYRGEDPTVPIKPLHKMTVKQATREMSAVGLALLNVLDDLPRQHVMIFQRAALTPAREPNLSNLRGQSSLY